MVNNRSHETCTPCTKSNFKCGGQKPRCGMCERYTRDCVYPSSVEHDEGLRATAPYNPEVRRYMFGEVPVYGCGHMVEGDTGGAPGLLSRHINDREPGAPPKREADTTLCTECASQQDRLMRYDRDVGCHESKVSLLNEDEKKLCLKMQFAPSHLVVVRSELAAELAMRAGSPVEGDERRRMLARMETRLEGVIREGAPGQGNIDVEKALQVAVAMGDLWIPRFRAGYHADAAAAAAKG